MNNKVILWSKNKYTKRQRFIPLIHEVIFFLVIIPILLFSLTYYIDEWFNLPKFLLEPVNIILAYFLSIIGLLFALCTIFIQFKLAKGTPAPMIPTQKLI